MKLWTTLIQGPITKDKESLGYIDKYKEYGDVIISCYSGDIEANTFENVNLDRVRIINNTFPKIPINDQCKWFSESTFYYALTTMYNGVLSVKTPYVIKTRSDEGWSTFDPFISQFIDDDFLVCGNIFCRKFEERPFHFGDHIFIVKTEYLKKALKSLLDVCDKGCLDTNMCAESVLCTFIFKSMGIKTSKKEYLDTVKIVDINKVKNFHASWQHAKIQYINSFVNPYGVYSNNDS
ncbi:MAG TPA: hypothetical protein DCM40_03510 [Maribacter sp.]|nr:hypothetical protein [Maribacter sp.]